MDLIAELAKKALANGHSWLAGKTLTV